MVKKSGERVKKPDIDLEIDDYEPSDSEGEYDNNEKFMLDQAAKRRSKTLDDEDDSEEEVFGIHDSDDDDDEEEEEEMDALEPLDDDMDSDIEGKNDEDHLPDSKAWGNKKNRFYNTDYVDQDYGGFSKAEEEEAALLEEEEARAIQTRLISELEDDDFSLGISHPQKSELKKDVEVEEDEFNEVIKTDLTKLSKREKLALLEKESPEFMGLVADFKERMQYAKDYLEPIFAMVKSGEIPQCLAAKFVSTKYHITLNYCTNITFYLLLKSKRVKVVNHPVIKRLVQYRKLLEEMDPIDKEIIQPQVLEILKRKEKGKKLKVIQSKMAPPVLIGNRAQRRKMIQQLKEEEEGKVKKPRVETFEEMQVNKEEGGDDPEELDAEAENDKRGITFEMAKNKGLTPKRKKENRNPRVKNRNKFRKATIRRKGQVRSVYSETPRYGGEPFGIKASVSKSIKLK